MTHDEEINNAEKKAAMLEWMLDTLASDKHIPAEKLDAFRRWLAEDSDLELKFDGLRRTIDMRSSFAFSRSEVDSLSETARERWRDLAIKLDMDPELDNYRAIRIRRRRMHDRHTAASGSSVRSKYAMRAAAVLVPVLIVVAGYLWFDGRGVSPAGDPFVSSPSYIATNSVSASREGVRHITLDDGTRVTLNRGGELSWNGSREASLSGEAYFRVAKDPEGRPFVIHSDHLRVTVLGTEFNFRVQDAEGTEGTEGGGSTLSLYEGSVRLDHATGTHLLDEAGKELSLDHTTGKTDIHDFDTTTEPEWMVLESLYTFHSLGDIFHSIEAEYGVRFENMNLVDTTQRISFRLREGTSLRALMSVIGSASGDFDYTIDANEETITLQPQK